VIRSFSKLGDRLLNALVPQAEAAAVPCEPYGSCKNHKKCRWCYHYGTICTSC
jgi:hypothetical protein